MPLPDASVSLLRSGHIEEKETFLEKVFVKMPE